MRGEAQVAEKQLVYICDDRETTIKLTTIAASRKVAIEIWPPTQHDHPPGLRLYVYETHSGMLAIREFLSVNVLDAFNADGVPDRHPMPVPFELQGLRVVLMLTPNDVRNLSEHILSIISLARSLTLVGVG